MKVKGIAWAAAVAALAAGSTVHAQQQETPRRAENLYVGAAFGKAKAEDVCSRLATCTDRDNSFGAFAGYWLQPSFALELGYHNLGNATAPGGTFVRSHAWELMGLGAWRPGDTFSFYGKLGVYRGAQEGGGALQAPKEIVTAVTYALGVQADLTKNLGLRGEWQNYPNFGGGPVLPRGDIRVVRVAALWRFR